MKTLIDTGPLVAVAHRDDKHHEACVRLLEELTGPLLLPITVLIEACWLVNKYGGVSAHAAFLGQLHAATTTLSLPEGTAEAIRRRVGKREFSAFITAAVERELRGQILDEYLADYERRKGSISAEAQDRARQVFDEVFAEESGWPAAS